MPLYNPIPSGALPINLNAGSYVLVTTEGGRAILESTGEIVITKTLISDTFNRADSAITMGDADTGQEWTAIQGTWGISGGKAYCISVVTNDITIVPNTRKNVKISSICTYNRVNSTDFKFSALVFKCLDINNYLFVRIANEVIAMFRVKGGVVTSLSSSAVPNKGSYFIDIICNMANILVDVDGVNAIDYDLLAEDAAFIDYVGVGLRPSVLGTTAANCTWDDYSVEVI